MSKFSLTKLANTVTNKMGKTGLKLQKSAPSVLVLAGIGGVIAATVMACHQTKKLDEIVDDFKEDLDALHEEGEKLEGEDKVVSEEEKDGYNADIARTYLHTGVRIAKLYGPTVILYGVSIGCILKSHFILKKRNLCMAAAYEALDQTYKRYRQNVIDLDGEEQDYRYLHRHEVHEKEVVEVDPETQEEITKKVGQVYCNVPFDGSELGRWFSKTTSVMFEGNPTYDLAYVKGREAMFNQLLSARGHVFLNEVYDAFGFDRTPAGAVVGWVFGDGGNDYIDFGVSGDYIYVLDDNGEVCATDEQMGIVNRDLSGGFWLDFNVDGIIYDKI